MSFEDPLDPLDKLNEAAEELQKKRTSTLAVVGVGLLALIALKILNLYFHLPPDIELSAYIIAALMIVVLLGFRLWNFRHPKAKKPKSKFQLLRERRKLILLDYRNTPEHIRSSDEDFAVRLKSLDDAIASEALIIDLQDTTTAQRVIGK